MSTQWFCRILQEELGPMDFEELQQLALSGTLDRGDLVRRDSEDAWTPASKCLELRATFLKLEPTAEFQPSRNVTALLTRIKTTSEERTTRQGQVSGDDTPREEAPRRIAQRRPGRAKNLPDPRAHRPAFHPPRPPRPHPAAPKHSPPQKPPAARDTATECEKCGLAAAP